VRHACEREIAGRSRIGGAARQQTDKRDYAFEPSRELLRRVAQAKSCDLRKSGFMPPVWDQGDGAESCSAHAIAAAWAFAEARALGLPPGRPSRLFIWYEGCKVQGNASLGGMDLRSGFYAVRKKGVPDEALWLYRPENFTKKPSPSVYTGANKLPIEYRSPTNTLEGLKAPLIAGYPVAAVFSVFASFEPQIKAKNFDFSMPAEGEEPVDQHAVLIVGFDDRAKKFTVRNSQGEKWGADGGYATLSYDFALSQHVMDFWTLMPKEESHDGR
jgi:Mimiviridae cathepsin B cystein protease